MSDMIDLGEARGDAEQILRIEAAEAQWPLSSACPSDYANRCKQRGVP